MFKSTFVLTFFLLAVSNLWAQPETDYLNAMMGQYPDAMHNTAYAEHVIYDTKPWKSDLSDPTQLGRMYGLIGARMDGWHTWAKHNKQGLELGGPKRNQSAEALWKFRCPQSTTFKEGKVTIVVQIPEKWEESETTPVISLHNRLTLEGGGEYFKTFTRNTSSPLTSQSINTNITTPQTITLDIPMGIDTLFVQVSRPLHTPDNAQVIVRALEVQAQLTSDRMLQIQCSESDGFWNLGDDATVKLRSTGRQAIAKAGYNLLRFDGQIYHPVKTVPCDLSNNPAELDINQFGAGYYRLEAFDQNTPQWILDRRDFVVLSQQDPAITPETSIFGAKQPDREPRLAKKMGIKWSSSSLLWAWSQAGVNKPMKFNDAWIDQAIADGMEPVVAIFTAPKWSNGNLNPTNPPLPANYKHWQAFNREAAKHLGDRVTWYETWNEPNNSHQLAFKGLKAKRAELAKTLQRIQYEGLREGNPNAKLVGGNFAGLYAEWVALWLEKDSVLDYQQAMSGHAYCRTTPDVHWAHKYPPEPDLLPRLVDFRKTMDQFGASDQPTFWTEFGWDAAEVSEAQQARWIARQFVMFQAYRKDLKTKAAFIFTFNPRFDYTIVRYPSAVDPWSHRLRPAVGAIATTSSLLAGSDNVAKHRDHPDTIRLYEFKKADQVIYAAWATEAAQTYTVNLPNKRAVKAVKVSMLGDHTPVSLSANEQIELPKNGDPVFFVIQ
jgi:hypothetical protein